MYDVNTPILFNVAVKSMNVIGYWMLCLIFWIGLYWRISSDFQDEKQTKVDRNPPTKYWVKINVDVFKSNSVTKNNNNNNKEKPSSFKLPTLFSRWYTPCCTYPKKTKTHPWPRKFTFTLYCLSCVFLFEPISIGDWAELSTRKHSALSQVSAQTNERLSPIQMGGAESTVQSLRRQSTCSPTRKGECLRDISLLFSVHRLQSDKPKLHL